MALERKEVPAAFVKGVDVGGKDPKLVSDELLKLENGRFTRQGAIGKRCGVEELDNDVTYDGETLALARYGSGFCKYGHESHVWRSVAADYSTTSSRKVVTTDVTVARPLFNSVNFSWVDCAETDDYIATVAFSAFGDASLASVYEKETGGIITGSTLPTSGAGAKVVATDAGEIWAVWVVSSPVGAPNAVINCMRFTGTSWDFSNIYASTVNNYDQNDGMLDAVSIGDDLIGIGTTENTGTNLRAIVFNTTTHAFTETNVKAVGGGAVGGVTVWRWPNQSNAYGIAYYDTATGTIYARVLDSGNTTIITEGSLVMSGLKRMTAVCPDPDADTSRFVYELQVGGTRPSVRMRTLNESGGALAFGGSDGATKRYVRLASKAFADKYEEPCVAMHFDGKGDWKSSPTAADGYSGQSMILVGRGTSLSFVGTALTDRAERLSGGVTRS